MRVVHGMTLLQRVFRERQKQKALARGARQLVTPTPRAEGEAEAPVDPTPPAAAAAEPALAPEVPPDTAPVTPHAAGDPAPGVTAALLSEGLASASPPASRRTTPAASPARSPIASPARSPVVSRRASAEHVAVPPPESAEAGPVLITPDPIPVPVGMTAAMGAPAAPPAGLPLMLPPDALPDAALGGLREAQRASRSALEGVRERQWQELLAFWTTGGRAAEKRYLERRADEVAAAEQHRLILEPVAGDEAAARTALEQGEEAAWQDLRHSLTELRFAAAVVAEDRQRQQFEGRLRDLEAEEGTVRTLLSDLEATTRGRAQEDEAAARAEALALPARRECARALAAVETEEERERTGAGVDEAAAFTGLVVGFWAGVRAYVQEREAAARRACELEETAAWAPLEAWGTIEARESWGRTGVEAAERDDRLQFVTDFVEAENALLKGPRSDPSGSPGGPAARAAPEAYAPPADQGLGVPGPSEAVAVPSGAADPGLVAWLRQLSQQVSRLVSAEHFREEETQRRFDRMQVRPVPCCRLPSS